ncbi:hypothetical protein ACPA9J_15615 [Pseudomonas aeruginosa]
MSMEFIRKAYAVPCKRGGHVIYRGRGTEERGTITSAKGAHLADQARRRKQAKEVPPDLGVAVPAGAGIATHRQPLVRTDAGIPASTPNNEPNRIRPPGGPTVDNDNENTSRAAGSSLIVFGIFRIVGDFRNLYEQTEQKGQEMSRWSKQ